MTAVVCRWRSPPLGPDRAGRLLLTLALVACGRTVSVSEDDDDTVDGGAAAPLAEKLVVEVDPPPALLAGDGARLHLFARVAGASGELRQRWVIRDGTGARRRELVEPAIGLTAGAGALSTHWDGLDDAGEPLEAGVHRVRVELIRPGSGDPDSEGEVVARSAQVPFTVLPAEMDTRLICRLVGKDAHNPATLQPDLRIFGTDMGVPVVVGERLYLLFGDTWRDSVCDQDLEPYLSLGGDTVIGSLPFEPRPDPETCLSVEFPRMADEPTLFQPALLDHRGARVPLRALGVATAAFEYRERLYGLFNPFHPTPCASDADCTSPAGCLAGVCNYRGLPSLPPRVLGVAEGPPGEPGSHFEGVAELDQVVFTNTTARAVNAVDGVDGPDYGNDAPGELLVFGRGHYIASTDTDGEPYDPWALYLLRQPIEPLLEQEAFNPRYFAGLDGDGAPRWTDAIGQAVPVARHESEVAAFEGGEGEPIRFIGTMAVSVIPPLGEQGFRWLMAYGGRPPVPVDEHENLEDPRMGIVVRLARHPWGPWTPPRRIWSVFSEDGGGELIFNPNVPGVESDAGRSPRVCGVPAPYIDVGVEYSPQVIEPFSRVDGDTLTIYWLLSSWNPYRVMQMRTEIRL